MSYVMRIVAGVLLSWSCGVHAQIMFHHIYYVGAGAGCDFADIQSAINAAVDGDEVFVTPTLSYDAQHLTINASILLAGASQCDVLPPPSTTTFAAISGAGGANAPVITIVGTHDVRIQGLEISGGHAGTGAGGGISYTGAGGSLTLADLLIDRNSAMEGGGVAMVPPGTTVPDLNIEDDVVIDFNTATDSGGGIYLGGGTQGEILGQRDLIAFNTANVSGGGIVVFGPAHVDLGSSGVNGLLVFDNTAQYGGGIAGYAYDTGKFGVSRVELVSLFTRYPNSPGEIIGNTASVEGGAVYLKGNQSGNDDGLAGMCAQDFRIIGNTAPEGAAIYLDNDNDVSGYLFMNMGVCQPTPLAVHCAAGVSCNEMSGNLAQQTSGDATEGGVVTLTGHDGGFDYPEVQALRLNMRGNEGGYLFFAAATAEAHITLFQCITGGNAFAHELVRMWGDHNSLDVRECTFAPDIINATHVFSVDDSASYLTFLDNLIDEPGTATMNFGGSLDGGNDHVDLGFIVSNDIGTFPASPNIVQGVPLFVDGANADPEKRDYHLRAYVQNGVVTASPGIDFAPAGSGCVTDFDGNPCDQNVPQVADFAGTHDLGAYEAQPIADRLFADGFGDPVSLLR